MEMSLGEPTVHCSRCENEARFPVAFRRPLYNGRWLSLCESHCADVVRALNWELPPPNSHLIHKATVACEVHAVISDAVSKDSWVLLQNAESSVHFVFRTGPCEAASIAALLHGHDAMRPTTHKLISSIIESFEATIDQISIDAASDLSLDDDKPIFTAQVSLRVAERKLVRDARPSDAVCLALLWQMPVLVTGGVLRNAPGLGFPWEVRDDTSID